MTSEERRILVQAREIRRRYRKKPEREPTLAEWTKQHPELMDMPFPFDATDWAVIVMFVLWVLAFFY